MSQSFTIPGRLMGMDEQRRVAFAARQARIKPVERPVMLVCTWYGTDRPDVIHDPKYIQDALMNMGILSRGGRRCAVGTVHWLDVDWANPRVEIEIQEL